MQNPKIYLATLDDALVRLENIDLRGRIDDGPLIDVELQAKHIRALIRLLKENQE